MVSGRRRTRGAGDPDGTGRVSDPNPRGRRAIDICKRLGRKLTPVVVDLGPDQPRFESYLEWVQTGKAGRALLAPIAGPVLARSLASGAAGAEIRIRSADPAEPWMIVVRALHVVSDQIADLDIEGVKMIRMWDRVRARTAAANRESLVLAVHPGAGTGASRGAALDGHVFPLVGLGPSHCLIETTQPLEPGESLGPVEVIGERRIIRRATGRLVEVIPWVTAHGHRRFRCRLALEEPTAPAALDSGHDLLSDITRITRLFELAGMVDLAGWYRAPGWPAGTMHIGESKDGLILLELDHDPPDALPPPDEVHIGFELFAASYEGTVRLHRHRGRTLEVALPLVLRRCRRRREQRAAVPATFPITVVFRNAATGETVRRPVRDLSFGGLCFETDVSADVLWSGACLEDARLEWDKGRVDLGELEVRAIERTPDGGARCHTANRGPAPADDPALVVLLATLYHPQVEQHDGSDFRVMVDLYEKAGLLGDFMLRNLRPVLPAAVSSWRKIHDRKSGVACTLVYRRNSQLPQGAVSAVRVWENTWFAQHFGVLPGVDQRVAGMLQLAHVDFVLPRPDAHYLAFFVRTENSTMNSFYERFFKLTGTPESVSRITVAVWMLRNGVNIAPVTGHDQSRALRAMRKTDEILVSRAAERMWGAMATSALSLIPRAIGLPNTSRHFSRVALERGRSAFIIDGLHGPAAALLKERISPGINLTRMLDAWWFLPFHSFAGADTSAVVAAATAIAQAPFDSPEGDKFLIVPSRGASKEVLSNAGFEMQLHAHLYVLSRSGLRRYYEYISDRYGGLNARVARREQDHLLELRAL
jgi:hypothetical protein